MGSLFGTDGIRGNANVYPITPELALNVGRAVACLLKKNRRAHVITGKDPRVSGDMIESAIAAGVCSAGGNVTTGGVLPTPAIAYLARSMGFDAGIMISASHNPYYDNGIKLFDEKGFKLSSEMEDRLEQEILNHANTCIPATHDQIGTIRKENDLQERYIDFITGSMLENIDFKGLKIVLDCSNGATSDVAPQVYARLGASVATIFNTPNGININDHCGSQHVSSLQQKVVETGADVGLAFDGDGDRLIAVDEAGKTVTGDQILAICAKHMKKMGKLENNLVVSTVVSNVGLKNLLSELGIGHVVTDVGDRYVLAAMLKHGAIIGGEDSGHMIFLDRHTSGDGILTGLRLIETMMETNQTLSALSKIMTVYPQVLKNVKIKEKVDIFSLPEIASIIKDVENRLDGKGRVLVRYSGTQPLCRVMVEGPDKETTNRCCTEIVDVIGQMIGA
jgi:phosphoglucosamine mutase